MSEFTTHDLNNSEIHEANAQLPNMEIMDSVEFTFGIGEKEFPISHFS